MTSDATASITAILIDDGCPAHLSSCLDSIRKQTSKPASIVVITADPSLRDLGPDIKIKSQTSTTQADLLNETVKESTSDSAIVMPTTDLLAPTFLARASESLIQYNSEGAISCVRTFESARLVSRAPATLIDLLAAPGQPIGFLFKKALHDSVGGFRPQAGSFAIIDFAIRARIKSQHLSQLEVPLYMHRETLNQTSIAPVVELHKDCYRDNLVEILHAKDTQIQTLTRELAPQCERLRGELEKLQFEHNELTLKYEQLSEHHRQALSSIKVTFKHLIKALSSKLFLRTN